MKTKKKRVTERHEYLSLTSKQQTNYFVVLFANQLLDERKKYEVFIAQTNQDVQ